MRLRLIFLLLLIVLSSQSSADHQPLWELGVGGAMLTTPDYRGAKSYSTFASPFPYGRYRGEKFRIDDSGVRQKLFDSDRLKLDMSLAGNIPVKNTSAARKGMPELDPLGEIGPVLQYRLWPAKQGNQSLWLMNPLRAVVSSDFKSIDYQGWTFSPYIEYFQRWHPTRRAYTLSVSAGPIFADSLYHNYFYQVKPAYADLNRTEYKAKAGYSGSRATVSFWGVSKRAWIGLFMRYDNLQGAVFDDSPMVETNNYLMGGVVVGWFFFSSEERAKHQR
jgi:outer membrane scaffolding protein for murein synthesis (MipA/OmpV family)